MNCILNLSKIIFDYYGDVYKGYYKDDEYIKPNMLEDYLWLLPSEINHIYGEYKGDYIFMKNGKIYNDRKIRFRIDPVILDIEYMNLDIKEIITKFDLNIKLIKIVNYLKLDKNEEIKVKYLKSGIKEKRIKLLENLEKSINELL